MKIAMVDPAAYSLPYDAALCEALGRAGHDVTLYTTQFAHGPNPPANKFRLVMWFYRRSFPLLPRRIVRALQHPLDCWRLRRHLRRERPDVLHIQWCPVVDFDTRYWRRAARALGIPVVFTAHNAKPRDDTGRSLTREELDRFDAVVVHTKFGEEALAELGVEPVWRIPLGAIDLYDTLPDPPVAPASLGEGPLVVMVGLLRPYKGAQVLLEAWPQVRAAIPDAELVIAGRPMGVTLPDVPPAGAHLVARFVTDEEYGWLLRRADVVCLPYLAVDMSAVLVTAMSMGRPMVLTEAGGFGEFLGHGAELVPAGDAKALANCLAGLLANPARREELGQQALEASQTTWNWDSIAATYTERYAEVPSAGAGAASPEAST